MVHYVSPYLVYVHEIQNICRITPKHFQRAYYGQTQGGGPALTLSTSVLSLPKRSWLRGGTGRRSRSSRDEVLLRKGFDGSMKTAGLVAPSVAELELGESVLSSAGSPSHSTNALPVLQAMRLLNTRTGDFQWIENPEDTTYAILSHLVAQRGTDIRGAVFW